MPNITIRPATHADIPAIHHMIGRSVRELSIYPPAVIEASVHTVLGLDTQLIEDQTYYIAELASEPNTEPSPESPRTIIASGGWSYRQTLAGANHAPNRSNALLNPATDAAKIRAIFVHPDHSRQGLGTRILHHCEAAARHAGFHKYEMGSTTTGAPLYARHGYVEQHRFHIPLPNNQLLEVVHMLKTTQPA